MRRVILKFNEQRDLRGFMQVIQCTHLEVNFKTRILICDCDDSEVELAQNTFNAVLAEEDGNHFE